MGEGLSREGRIGSCSVTIPPFLWYPSILRKNKFWTGKGIKVQIERLIINLRELPTGSCLLQLFRQTLLWEWLVASPVLLPDAFLSSMAKADVTISDFNAFLEWEDARIWARKVFWKYLSEGLFCQFFPEHGVPHSWSPPWTPFRGSAAAVER